MNMKKAQRCLAIALVLLLLGSTAGCFDEITEPTYDDDPLVQFDPTSGVATEGDGAVALNIQLIAPHQSDDKTFPISVVDSTTTVPGDVYSVESSAVILADSSFGNATVNVGDGSLESGESGVLTLLIGTSSDGEIAPAENFRFFTLTINGQ